MEFPKDIERLIHEYARPIGLRLDWRTCKRKESRRIKMSNRALGLWLKYMFGARMMEEMMKWTFYGRRHLIWSSKREFWTHGIIPAKPDERDTYWYKKQYVWLAQRNIPPLFDKPVELIMCDVSLIV
jgi:hypothetical protein